MSALRVEELTARAPGGVRVVSVRGPGALARVRPLLLGRDLAPGAFELARLRTVSEGRLLDEALVWVASEEEVELHLHGSGPLVRSVLQELGGARPTHSPTLEERAGLRLAEAPSEAAARILLDQSRGALRSAFLSLAELGPEALGPRTDRLLEAGRVAGHLLRPPPIVLAGPVNAGKSTLFNVLFGRERVVVDAAEGTTRDVVRERVTLGEYAFDLVDTAGTRVVPEGEERELEQAGQALGHRLLREAALVLWLDPDGAPPPAELGDSVRAEAVVRLRSRADESPESPELLGPHARLSARTDPEAARTTVEEAVRKSLGLPPDPWQPGAPVPFEEAQLEGLRALRSDPGDRALRERVLSSLLRERPPGDSDLPG